MLWELKDYNGENQIDHIDGNKLNNQIYNLRIATPSENAQNKSKSKGKTSKYVGVSLEKKTGKWKASMKVGNLRLRAYYEKEEHAAYQRNLWIDEYKSKAKKCEVSAPSDFILWKSARKKLA